MNGGDGRPWFADVPSGRAARAPRTAAPHRQEEEGTDRPRADVARARNATAATARFLARGVRAALAARRIPATLSAARADGRAACRVTARRAGASASSAAAARARGHADAAGAGAVGAR